MERLKDKVILVTASTRGIGLAAVKRLAQEGAIVYMAARRLDAAEEEARAIGDNVKTVYFNAYEDCYKEMIETVVNNEGRIDGIVNNFGTSDPRKDRTIEATDWDVFKDTVNVNLESVFRTCQEAIPYMKEHGGSIVNISSIGGAVPDVSQIAYGTSKSAIDYLTKLIAVQEARNNIRCNAVLPGMTATDAVTQNLSGEFKEFFLRHTPIKRMGEPEEVAAAIAFFLSDDSQYVTGQILEVAGGFGLPTPIYGDMMAMGNKR